MSEVRLLSQVFAILVLLASTSLQFGLDDLLDDINALAANVTEPPNGYNCCDVWLRDGDTGVITKFDYKFSATSVNTTNYTVTPDYWSNDTSLDMCIGITFGAYWILYKGCRTNNTMVARARKLSNCLNELTTNKSNWTSISNVQTNQSQEWLENQEGTPLDYKWTCNEPAACLPCKKVLDGNATIQGEYSFVGEDDRCSDKCKYENTNGDQFCFLRDDTSGENYVQQGCEPGLVWTTTTHTP